MAHKNIIFCWLWPCSMAEKSSAPLQIAVPIQGPKTGATNSFFSPWYSHSTLPRTYNPLHHHCCWLNLHFPWLNPCISSMVKSFIKPHRIVTLRNRSFPHGLTRNMEIHPSTGRCEAMRSLDLLPSSARGSSGFCLLGPRGLSDNGVNPQRCWLVVWTFPAKYNLIGMIRSNTWEDQKW